MKLITAVIKPFKLDEVKDALKAAGITEGKVVALGSGRVQTVQCFIRSDVAPSLPDLCDVLRWFEDRGERSGLPPQPARVPASIQDGDVPY